MSNLTAEQWNATYPVGTPVTAYPDLRPEHPAFAEFRSKRLETRTRSIAWNLGHGEPVVLIDDYSGGISLKHIDLREEPCPAEFTPPSADAPMPCTKAAHPGDQWHEAAPVGDPGRSWTWQDGAPGTTRPTTEETSR
ncbi:hypothetical protein [Kitasatospora sp. NPDC058478]|uniref:hypothetical protein n=1 Tax=unclassified Kitasatospora TaxID=2633591 RepID=UPI003649FF3E